MPTIVQKLLGNIFKSFGLAEFSVTLLLRCRTKFAHDFQENNWEK